MATDLDEYLASRKYEERYPDVDTYDNAYLGLSAPAEDNNDNEGVKGKRRRARRR
jgi:hypothetical protein